MVYSRVDEMIRNVESFEGKSHIHQVNEHVYLYSLRKHVLNSIFDLYLLQTFRMISEHRYGYVRSSRWHFKNVFGHFCLSDFMGECAERLERKFFRNN